MNRTFSQVSKSFPMLALTLALALVLVTVAGVGPATAQQRGSGGGAGGGTGPTDPAIIQAREDTLVVLDLGRLIGFVGRVDEEFPRLALNRDQARRLTRLMDEISLTARLTPVVAERMMIQIEDEILTAAQLLQVDRLWAEADRTREGTSSGTSSAGRTTTPGTESGGSGSLSSYVAGGPYNPLVDTTRPQGQDFEALYQRLQGR